MDADQQLSPEWKMEPLSLIGDSPLFDINEDWIIFNDNVDLPDECGEVLDLPAKNLTKAEVATKLLEDLDSWAVKEEPLQDWLEEKIDIPIFADISPELALPTRTCANIGLSQSKSSPVQHATSNPAHLQQLLQLKTQVDTQNLLQEFDNMLSDVGTYLPVDHAASTLTLTPPQSPPPAISTAAALSPIQHVSQHVQLVQQQQEEQIIDYSHELHRSQLPEQQLIEILLQPQQDVNDYEMEEISVEQIGLEDGWSTENLSIDSSLLTDSSQDGQVLMEMQEEIDDVDEYVRACMENSEPSSPFTSSSDTGSFEDSSEDPDWSGDTEVKLDKPKLSSLNSFRAGRKPRPYPRPGPEEKRVRKKEQNKNAATRYRLKKKQEIKEILTEEQGLVLKNESLTAKVDDLQREIGYLKNLMRDLCRAKGLIK